KAKQGPESRPAGAQEPTLSTDRPPIVVEGRQLSELREEDRIGPYGQPRWTAKRRFANTRVYVLPEGQVEFTYWHISELPKHGGPTLVQTEYEVEFGLPYRFQLDLYAVSKKQGNDGPLDFDEQRVELRYALADWGKIWGNPTLYLEGKSLSDEPDHFEVK